MLQKLQTGNPLVLWVRIWKMLSDVSKGRCSQQRIHDRMEKHICI